MMSNIILVAFIALH